MELHDLHAPRALTPDAITARVARSTSFEQSLHDTQLYQHAVSRNQALKMFQDTLALSTTTHNDLRVLDILDAPDSPTPKMIVPILSQADAHARTAQDAASVVERSRTFSNFYREDAKDLLGNGEHPPLGSELLSLLAVPLTLPIVLPSVGADLILAHKLEGLTRQAQAKQASLPAS